MENPHGHRSILLQFMSHNDGVTCRDDRVFLIEELGGITAQDVVDWFNFRAFGTTAPTPETRPTSRSNSLQHWKKALSCHMPNQNHQWDETASRGNPTKSQALDDLIERVKRFEVRSHGAPPKA